MSKNNNYDPNTIYDKVLKRPIYVRLTKDLLESTPAEDLTQLVIDTIQHNGSGKSDGEIYAGLTRGQKLIYSTYILETQVFNGGFGGFYLNTQGELNDFLEQDLIAIGAKALAEIVKRANDLCVQILGDLADAEQLDPLDEEFYNLTDADSLETKRIRYIKSNIAEFVTT